MKNKELKIIPPEGYKIDKERSTFECIKFKLIKDEKRKKIIKETSEDSLEYFFSKFYLEHGYYPK